MSVEVRVGDVIGLDVAEIPPNVLEVQGRVGKVWQRTTGDDRYDEDGADYEWTADGWLASDEGVLSCGPLRVTKVAQ